MSCREIKKLPCLLHRMNEFVTLLQICMSFCQASYGQKFYSHYNGRGRICGRAGVGMLTCSLEPRSHIIRELASHFIEIPSLQRHWEPDLGGSFKNYLEGSFFLSTSWDIEEVVHMSAYLSKNFEIHGREAVWHIMVSFFL